MWGGHSSGEAGGRVENLDQHSHFLGRSSSCGTVGIRSRKWKKVSKCRRTLARTCTVVASGEGIQLVYSSWRQASSVLERKHMLCVRVLNGTRAIRTNI